MRKSKRKAKCPCCKANGFIVSIPAQYPERKHWQDSSNDKDTLEGYEDIKGQWVAGCIHETGKMIESKQEEAHFECNCSCSEW